MYEIMMYFILKNINLKSVHSTAPDYEMHEIMMHFHTQTINEMSKMTLLKTNGKYL